MAESKFDEILASGPATSLIKSKLADSTVLYVVSLSGTVKGGLDHTIEAFNEEKALDPSKTKWNDNWGIFEAMDSRSIGLSFLCPCFVTSQDSSFTYNPSQDNLAVTTTGIILVSGADIQQEITWEKLKQVRINTKQVTVAAQKEGDIVEGEPALYAKHYSCKNPKKLAQLLIALKKKDLKNRGLEIKVEKYYTVPGTSHWYGE